MGGKTSKKKEEDSILLTDSDSSEKDPDLESLQQRAERFFGTLASNSTELRDFDSFEPDTEQDPDLERFGRVLHRSRSRVIKKLASGRDVRSLSFDELVEVTNCLLDMNQNVVNIVLPDMDALSKHKNMLVFVNRYFAYGSQSVELCKTLEQCLQRAKRKQKLIASAYNTFEKEATRLKHGKIKAEKYEQMIDELRRVTEEDIFTEQFFVLLNQAFQQQAVLLEEMKTEMRRVKRKIRRLAICSKVSIVVFLSVLVCSLAFIVIAAYLKFPPVVQVVAGFLPTIRLIVKNWLGKLWKRCHDEAQGRKEIISYIRMGTYIDIGDMERIRSLVQRVEVILESLVKRANLVIKEKTEVNNEMAEIKKRMDEFTVILEGLCHRASTYAEDMMNARNMILRRLHQYNQKQSEADYFEWFWLSAS